MALSALNVILYLSKQQTLKHKGFSNKKGFEMKKEDTTLEIESSGFEDVGFEDERRPIAKGRDGFLTWNAFWVSTDLSHDRKEENYAVYAFVLSQVEGGALIDSSFDGHHANTICYPYAATFGNKPLKDGAIGSVKDSRGFASPLTLHKRLASKIENKQDFDTMDYCISRYLESNDPYYFCLYYLTYGFNAMQTELLTLGSTLDDHAKKWVLNQCSIFEKVEREMIRIFTNKKLCRGMTPLQGLHEILTGHNHLNTQTRTPLSTLEDLINLDYFVAGYAVAYLNYMHDRSAPSKYLEAFIKKYVG